MFARRRSPWGDVLAGAAAGAVGSWLMSPVQSLISKRLPQEVKDREKAISPAENATVKAARLALEKLGIDLPDESKSRVGQAVHYGFGAGMGALYGLLRNRLPDLPRATGLLFGAALWLFADELAVPALRLSAPANKYPKETHLRALAAHLAYGASLEGGSLLGRALA